jgi:hypothetical protein
MKIAYFHEDEITLAYDVDDLDGKINFEIGKDFELTIGCTVKHPKDPPNRKVGNQIAASRIISKVFTVIDLIYLQNGDAVLVAKCDSLILTAVKRNINKNFYINTAMKC